MPPKSQMSAKAQIGLCLGVLLFVSVALTIAGAMAANQTSAKMTAFASDGATVTGTITKKYIHSVSRNWVYWLDVRFTSANGFVHNKSTNVANSLWYNYDAGGPVQVTYSRSNPQWFYVAGDAPTERDVGMSNGMFQYGLIASLFIAISLVAFLFLTRGGGSSSDARGDAPSSSPASFRPRQTRTGFGLKHGRG